MAKVPAVPAFQAVLAVAVELISPLLTWYFTVLACKVRKPLASMAKVTSTILTLMPDVFSTASHWVLLPFNR